MNEFLEDENSLFSAPIPNFMNES